VSARLSISVYFIRKFESFVNVLLRHARRHDGTEYLYSKQDRAAAAAFAYLVGEDCDLLVSR
jgi:hypothetical protein